MHNLMINLCLLGKAWVVCRDVTIRKVQPVGSEQLIPCENNKADLYMLGSQTSKDASIS